MRDLTNSLSIIIPTYNEGCWLPETISAISTSLSVAAWEDYELIVVVDGSTDDTLLTLRNINNPRLRVVYQPNSGRFIARQKGLALATGTYVLLLDSRVRAHPGAMTFLKDRLRVSENSPVWNGDHDLLPDRHLLVLFWKCLIHAMWRKYFVKREESSFDSSSFDQYPKGTGFFFAPRHLLIDACEQFKTSYSNLHLSSDDTTLLRYVASKNRINISPQFKADYYGRTSLRSFVSHAFRRGTTFVDSFSGKGSRFVGLVRILPFTPVLLLCSLFWIPIGYLALVLFAVMLSLYWFFSRVNLTNYEILGFCLVLPLFVAPFWLGMIRGLFLKLGSKMLLKFDASASLET